MEADAQRGEARFLRLPSVGLFPNLSSRFPRLVWGACGTTREDYWAMGWAPRAGGVSSCPWRWVRQAGQEVSQGLLQFLLVLGSRFHRFIPRLSYRGQPRPEMETNCSAPHPLPAPPLNFLPGLGKAGSEPVVASGKSFPSLRLSFPIYCARSTVPPQRKLC